MKRLRGLLLVAILLGLIFSTGVVMADTSYTVQPNDNLSQIARQFGTTVEAIVAANDIADPNIIPVGSVLIIPTDGEVQDSQPPTESQQPPVEEPPPVEELPQQEASVSPPAPQAAPAPTGAAGTYTVQTGDNLSKIANMFGTNYLVLAALNNIEEPYIVALGQVLNVPGAPAQASEPSASQDAAPSEQTAVAEPAAAPEAPPAPAAPPAAPVALPSLGGGFELGGQTQSFANRELMNSIGMNWVKFQHKWSPGDSADAVAGRIADAHNSGFKVLLSIPGANTYPEPGGIDFAAYVEFLRGVAALGPDAIEIWNEMNIDFEWPAGEIDPASYVNNMLAPAYNAIKSTNPNVMVVGGALAPTGFDNGHNAWADNRYLAGMAAAGAASYMDCIGVHHNAGATPPAAGSGHPGGGHYSWYFQPTMDLYYNSFGGATKVCFTELGYVSPDGFSGISPNFSWAAETSTNEHAQWLAQAINLAANSGKARLLIIFNVDFTGYDPNGDPQAGYAIVRPDGSCPFCELVGQ